MYDALSYPWDGKPMFGPRARLEARRAAWRQRGRGWPRTMRQPNSQQPDAVSFRFDTSFDGSIMIEARSDTGGLIQYGSTCQAIYGRRFIQRTMRLPRARRQAFWREIARLGIWQWPHDTMPGGCDGSTFEITLRQGRRAVAAGWWVGRPGRRLVHLCRALDRLTKQPVVDFVLYRV
jgi:hypothetical protein